MNLLWLFYDYIVETGFNTYEEVIPWTNLNNYKSKQIDF